MDGQQISFTGSSFPLRPSKDQAFPPHSPILADDENLGPNLGYPLSDFQISPSFPAGFAVPGWEQGQSVHRYLNDDQMLRTLFHAEAPSTTPPRRLVQRTVGVPIVPAPSHPGFASPLSSIDTWTGTNSAVSPAADTESCYDNFPATPPDTTVITPFSHPTQLEWARNTSALHFVNMGPASNATCNLVDIDPSQHLGYGEPDGSSVSFDLTTQTSFGFESYPAQCEVELPRERASAAQPGSMSILEDTRPTVADEIKAIRYPPPPAQSGDDDDDDDDDEDECDASDEVVDAPAKKRATIDEDYDDDYIPGKKLKASTSANLRKTRPKQASSSRAPKSPAKKKARAAGSIPQPELYAAPSGPTKLSFRCDKCDQGAFKDVHGLQTHIKKQHNQPFKCVFHFAGCTAIFPSKNEWKRHVDTQHLLHKYYICRDGACGKSVAADKIFRRKDLFTQHLRRMHKPASLVKASKHSGRKGGPSAEAQRRWDDYVAARQMDCEHVRCLLPQRMRCPVERCAEEFKGLDAWDIRMEHVAKHLERAAQGEEPAVQFGGDSDTTLIEWATQRDVNVVRRGPGDEGWVLNDPVEGGLGPYTGGNVGVEDEQVMGEIVVDQAWDAEVDAEGEEYDE